MKLIIEHIDDLLDYFPINPITKKMRMDLIETTMIDYESQTSQGVSSQEASQSIISNIASPEVFATMIPNTHSLYYYILWAISILVTAGIFYYVSNPNFLQFFLPARMEFPDIIEKYIHYFFITLLAYGALCYVYRMLPQKHLDRSTTWSAVFLYTGTVMAALYFSIAIAFIWYTFNGYLPTQFAHDFVSSFTYSFYKIFFSSEIIVVIYAIINAAMFVLSRRSYHLELKAEPYVFEKIYATSTKPTVYIKEALSEEVKQPSGISKFFSKFKKNKPKEEKTQPTFAALEVTEEVVSFLLESSN